MHKRDESHAISAAAEYITATTWNFNLKGKIRNTIINTIVTIIVINVADGKKSIVDIQIYTSLSLRHSGGMVGYLVLSVQ